MSRLPLERRTAGRWLLAALAIAVLAAGERGGRWACARWASAAGTAEWIWADGGRPGEGGEAFFAVRDFELSDPAGPARILILGDEEYLLYLDGRFVGSGHYRDGAALDAWEAEGGLAAGTHRVTVELRSGRGAGGLLFRLETGEAGALSLVSGAEWRIVRRWHPGLLRPGTPLDGAEEPRVWSTSPVGRWGLPAAGVPAPADADRRSEAEPLEPWRARLGEGGGEWLRLHRPGGRPETFGRWATFEWEPAASGYLDLTFAGKAEVRALVWAGERPPHPHGGRPAAWVVGPPGRGSWTDSEPRRHRFVTVVSTVPLVGARVFPSAREPRPEAPGGGVFGLDPLGLDPPLEHEVWRELERVTRLASGEAP